MSETKQNTTIAGKILFPPEHVVVGKNQSSRIIDWLSTTHAAALRLVFSETHFRDQPGDFFTKIYMLRDASGFLAEINRLVTLRQQYPHWTISYHVPCSLGVLNLSTTLLQYLDRLICKEIYYGYARQKPRDPRFLLSPYSR